MDLVQLPYFQEYLLSLENNNYSKETVANYARDLDIFAAFLHDRKLDFDGVTKLVISEYKGFLRNQNYIPILRAYKASLQAEDTDDSKDIEMRSEKQKALYKGRLASRSVNRMLSSLRSYLNFLVDIDEEVPLPPSAIKLIKAEKKEKHVADLNELVKLIESPMQFEKDPKVQLRNRVILELIFATGMRISEVVNLDREQVKFENGQITDYRIYIEGKGKKQRLVYLTDRAKLLLADYMQSRDDSFPAMFIPTKGSRLATHNPYIVRLSQNYIQSKIIEYRRALGIIIPTSAHSLRHGFATYLAEEGASPTDLQRLLGHESLQTTTRYVHTSDRSAETSHRRFHPLKEAVAIEQPISEDE